ncbi:MAG: hypothetical protein DCC72_06825 [Burkholderiales bacterium]|nr:MAG: hypothetical protein DCC72_06825 [Burkholderiales bacterium]
MPTPASRRAPQPPAPARFVRVALPLALVALAGAGCATTDEVRYGNVVATPGAYDPSPYDPSPYGASPYAVRQPLSLGEIVAALRSGRSSHDIADDVDENGLLAPATSADIDLLLQSGADAELIDAVREASAMAGRGPVSPPVTAVPPGTVSPPVIVTPPLYPSYGWYPYAPYVPFSFGLWYQDAPRYRPPHYRPDRPGPDRWRPGDDRRGGSRPPPPNWQSPRMSPTPPGGAPGAGSSIRPGGSPAGSPRVSPGGSPRVSPGGTGGPAPGAVRDRRSAD